MKLCSLKATESTLTDLAADSNRGMAGFSQLQFLNLPLMLPLLL